MYTFSTIGSSIFIYIYKTCEIGTCTGVCVCEETEEDDDSEHKKARSGCFCFQSSAAWKTDCDSILQKTSEADSCDTGTDTARL